FSEARRQDLPPAWLDVRDSVGAFPYGPGTLLLPGAGLSHAYRRWHRRLGTMARCAVTGTGSTRARPDVGCPGDWWGGIWFAAAAGCAHQLCLVECNAKNTRWLYRADWLARPGWDRCHYLHATPRRG